MPEVEIEELQIRTSNEPREVTVKSRASDWSFLPFELWLIILVDYGLNAKDIAKLDLCCKWFSNPWQGKFFFVIPA